MENRYTFRKCSLKSSLTQLQTKINKNSKNPEQDGENIDSRMLEGATLKVVKQPNKEKSKTNTELNYRY